MASTTHVLVIFVIVHVLTLIEFVLARRFIGTMARRKQKAICVTSASGFAKAIANLLSKCCVVFDNTWAILKATT